MLRVSQKQPAIFSAKRFSLRALWAATAVMCNVATGSAPDQSCSSGAQSPPTYPLLEKWQQSNDSWLLRFGLPSDRTHLGDDPALPTCISVHHNDTLDGGKLLKKSYSPVSHPGAVGTFDLLVKAYKPQPGGGVGAAICDLKVGQELTGKVKAKRVVHGSAYVSRRWDRIGLIAGGTGVAPLVQIIRIVLEDPEDAAKIQLLSVNRYEEDILMRKDLDELARIHPERFQVSYSLTGDRIPDDWTGYTGRGSVELARKTLPSPSDANGTTMIFVCGTDGFRDMWAGPIGRGPPKEDGSKGPKIQGPLLGLLKDAGYAAADVFKY